MLSRVFLGLLAIAVSQPAMAQVSSLNSGVTQSELAAVQAAVPQPATAPPATEGVGGATGTMTSQYALANHAHPRISRTGSCTLNASGVCTATWLSQGAASPFPAGTVPVMLGDPVAINTVNTFPISCNVTSAPTLTGVSVKCWQGQSSLVSVLGANVIPFNATLLTGVTVTVGAFPGT